MNTPDALTNEDRLIVAARDVIRASCIDNAEFAVALTSLKNALRPWADSEYADYLAEVERHLGHDLEPDELFQVEIFYAAGHTTRQAAAALA